ncbi:restriction endonuclease subunit S [Nioella nitratireducens]|uniref:restriction endonuclease subunit S n=1 Tax=Nioella nitratireducens TaxID=1287720 RepID=UPI0008FD84F9|nr:restriction endonuclease subunit S [Nioella nitratireducens]
MSEMVPEGWEGKKIGEIASIIMGQSPSSDTYNTDRKGIPFFQGKADFGAKYPTVRYWCTAPSKIAPKDAILFSVRAPVGDINRNNTEACIGRGLAALSGVTVEQDFLFHSLTFSKKEFDALGQGSTFEAINGSELRNFLLPIPPLPEQKKIAAILTSVDEVIESTQKQIDKLQDLKKATMNELLTKGIGHTEFKDSELGRIPKSWEVKTLSDIAEIISGYAFSSSDFVDRGILCIRMGNLYGNVFDENRSPAYLPDSFSVTHPKFLVSAGDLLLSMTGTAGKRDYGYLVIVPENFNQGLLNQRVSKIIPKHEEMTVYIRELMRSDLYLNELFSFGSGTKQANLSASQIMGINVPVPPLDEQFMIGKSISAVVRSIAEKASMLSQLKSLKKSLMQDLLTGKVRVKVD